MELSIISDFLDIRTAERETERETVTKNLYYILEVYVLKEN